MSAHTLQVANVKSNDCGLRTPHGLVIFRDQLGNDFICVRSDTATLVNERVCRLAVGRFEDASYVSKQLLNDLLDMPNALLEASTIEIFRVRADSEDYLRHYRNITLANGS